MKKALFTLLSMLLLVGPVQAANVTIGDLTADAAPVSTHLIETETAGGASRKVTLGNAAKGMSSTNLSDTADLLYETELDSFSEAQSQISDKTLVNEEDSATFDSTITFATAPALPAASVDAITEVAAGIRSGSDNTLLTGTPGSTDDCAKWDANGDLVSAGAACGSGSGVGNSLDTEVMWNNSGTADGISTLTTDGSDLTFTGTFNAGGGTLEIPNGITLPAFCTIGQQFMDTDATTGQRHYLCESTNTWALQGDGNAAGSNVVTAASTFGTDNRLIKSDGTGRGVQVTGVTVDDSNNISGVNNIIMTGTLTIQGSGNNATGDLTWTGTMDFETGSLIIPNSNDPIPASCTAGMIYMDNNATSGQRIYGCESGSWVLQGGTGGASFTSISLEVQSAKLIGSFVTDGDATQGAAVDGSQGNWRLLFDATTDEAAVWQFRMPNNYSSDPILKVGYSMVSATTLEVEFEGAIMCVSDGDAADIGTASFSAIAVGSATVPGTAGHLDEISITLTDDSCAAGDFVAVYLSTDSDDATNDDATGDREVVYATLTYTGS